MEPIGNEVESRRVAEEAREREWAGRGVLREIFLGRFHFGWIEHFPETAIREPAREFLVRLRTFLEQRVDSARIDQTGEYPEHVIQGLRELGAFGMKIPVAYGGLGFNIVEYARAIELCAEYDGNIVALLSAHQSIGVPQPIELFGTEEQKRNYLPRCARGAISAFALTEPDVGSDPASLATTATKMPDGSYVLNGEKLWCTNGTVAELIVVMARDPETKRISAFVVEASWPGVEVVQRCRFMGLRAIENGVLRFRDVRVPKENLIGREGEGLKIALVTLNTGRLSLPAACVGFTKRCTEIVREWSNQRVQWGLPIGKHEAVTHKLAYIASTTYAIESVTRLATELASREGYDIRLEAAAAKEFATVEGWRIADDTMQIRAGRGYETETSLAARGEPPIGVERIFRDVRINLIFEGSSEIMHLFMAREAVDRHLQVAGSLLDPKKTFGQKLRAFVTVLFFYAWWYPSRWLPTTWPWSYARHGELGRHLRYCERASRRLARAIFHGMLVHRAGLERRQAFLFRVVDIANLIFAMSASIARARGTFARGDATAASAIELAGAFSRQARRNIEQCFRALWHNDDVDNYAVGRNVLDGRYEWLESVYADHGEPIGRPFSTVRESGAAPAAGAETRRSA